MDRPTEKLLKDMTSEELSAESKWHQEEAAKLYDEVGRVRAEALEAGEQDADAMLHTAMEIESEAEAHIRQSNILDTLRASRLPAVGVGVVQRAAKA